MRMGPYFPGNRCSVAKSILAKCDKRYRSLPFVADDIATPDMTFMRQRPWYSEAWVQDRNLWEQWHFQCVWCSQRLAQNVDTLVNIMGASPIPFIFAQLWLLCAAVRPSIDEEAWAAFRVKRVGKSRVTSRLHGRERLSPHAGSQFKKTFVYCANS